MTPKELTEAVIMDKNASEMTWFQAFRGDFGYANYGEYRTSVTYDISLATVIYACVLISIAALVAAAGIRGKERWYTLLRLVYSLAVGSIIVVSIFGYCWQTGSVRVNSRYIYRVDGQVVGTVGVRIGLQTVNITLSGSFRNSNNKVDYNEELNLEKAGSSFHELGHSMLRGLPQPLLTVQEYFDIDEGGLRFGRNCRLAGHFTGILLWTGFAFWLTANILLCSVIWYGAAMFTLTGICMVLAAVVYHVMCPALPIIMPCSDGPLVLHYGWCFWSNLVLGCVTILLGLVLFIMDHKLPKKLATFFLLESPFDEESTDEFKQISPLPVERKANDRRMSVPVNWYLNYGYQSNKLVNGNPIFHGSSSDLSTIAASEQFEVSRMKPEGFKDDDGAKSLCSVQRDNKFNEQQSLDTMDRLREIYVDIESAKSKQDSVTIDKVPEENENVKPVMSTL